MGGGEQKSTHRDTRHGDEPDGAGPRGTAHAVSRTHRERRQQSENSAVPSHRTLASTLGRHSTPRRRRRGRPLDGVTMTHIDVMLREDDAKERGNEGGFCGDCDGT